MSDEPSSSQLIVIGSSAGGIEALSTLVSTLPTPFPAPIVIAQHLDPSRPSHLGEILERRSPVPVVTVRDHEQLQVGTVYVVPSNHHVEVTDHDITLLPDGAGRPKPSIDLLLSSASEIYSERLVAVILTGTGSDGVMGARAVKEAGGTVIIQNPDTAAFPGMPQAIEPQIVDIVADLPRIGSILFDLLTGVAVPTQADAQRELIPFLEQVHEYTGIDFSSYKTPTILRRLQRRIIAAGTSDLASYKQFLDEHPDEYHRLASSFLIKVTDFMRDPELFDTLRNQVIPTLVAASRESGNELRIWSAGCATGQEAYSLAILVLEALGDELPNFTVKIFATDLDSEAVAFARHGLYPSGTLTHMPEDLLDRYFTRLEAGYEVKKLVRGLVVFGEHDLAERAPFPRIDMVLCRNVLIYFARNLQQRALELFAFSLREGGYLVLGKTETVSPASDFFTPELPQFKIYRRYGKMRPTSPFQIQWQRTPSANPSMSQSAGTVQSGSRRQVRQVGTTGTRGQDGSNRELFQAQQESLQTRLSRERLLLNLPVGVVVVDRRYDIQEINSAARRLLGIHTVALGEDLLHLAHNVPNRAFRAAIDTAFREKTVTKLEEVQVPEMSTGEPSYLRIECYPQPRQNRLGSNPDGEVRVADERENEDSREAGSVDTTESVLVLVSDITEMINSRREMEESATLLSAQAEEVRAANLKLSAQAEDLKVANESLRASNEETLRSNISLEEVYRKAAEVAARHAQQIEMLGDANLGLLAANHELTETNSELRVLLDEFVVTNEEAQAAVEEVETLNEEMQATNEELETLNEELQATIEELNTSNADLAARGDELQNLAHSLEVQKVQLEAILAGLADAVLVITPEGTPLLMNEAYRYLFGSGHAISGRKDFASEHIAGTKEAAHFTDREGRTVLLLDEHLRPLRPEETPQMRAARGEMFSITVTLVSTSGEEPRYLEAIGQPVTVDHEQKWGVVVMRDITERSLRVMQEEFSALASHELRTPLTVIKGYLQMLHHSLEKQEADEHLISYVQRALTQTNRQVRLIDDLLDVARIQTGKFSLRLEPVRLDTLLEHVVESGQILANGQKIELTIDGDPFRADAVAGAGADVGHASEVDNHATNEATGSLLVNADANRLEQAVFNLLTNAYTHAPESTRIDVRLCRLEGMNVDGKTKPMVEINVQDYGKGIPAQNLPNVFTRFYQVGQRDPLPTQGLGLGLFITRQIVEAHGGSISVESKEGEGTTFIIRLPLIEQSVDLET